MQVSKGDLERAVTQLSEEVGRRMNEGVLARVIRYFRDRRAIRMLREVERAQARKRAGGK